MNRHAERRTGAAVATPQPQHVREQAVDRLVIRQRRQPARGAHRAYVIEPAARLRDLASGEVRERYTARRQRSLSHVRSLPAVRGRAEAEKS